MHHVIKINLVIQYFSNTLIVKLSSISFQSSNLQSRMSAGMTNCWKKDDKNVNFTDRDAERYKRAIASAKASKRYNFIIET